MSLAACLNCVVWSSNVFAASAVESNIFDACFALMNNFMRMLFAFWCFMLGFAVFLLLTNQVMSLNIKKMHAQSSSRHAMLTSVLSACSARWHRQVADICLMSANLFCCVLELGSQFQDVIKIGDSHIAFGCFLDRWGLLSCKL